MNFVAKLWSDSIMNTMKDSILTAAILGANWYNHVPFDEEPEIRQTNKRQACMYD
jgi:hypothetical protein